MSIDYGRIAQDAYTAAYNCCPKGGWEDERHLFALEAAASAILAAKVPEQPGERGAENATGAQETRAARLVATFNTCPKCTDMTPATTVSDPVLNVDAGCEAARTNKAINDSGLSMPGGSNPRTSRAPAIDRNEINGLTCANAEKATSSAPATVQPFQEP